MSISTLASVTNRDSNGRFHWSVDAFYHAVAAGVFDDPNRLELISGELWKKEPMNPPHALLIEAIRDVFLENLRGRFWIREEKPFHIDWDGEPVPDISLVSEGARRNRANHSGSDDMRLVVEVADTSVDRDTCEKANLYAQAGIADYWVSLIPTRELIVFRQPSNDGYQETVRLTDADLIRPLAAPDVEFAVRDLIVQSDGDKIE